MHLPVKGEGKIRGTEGNWLITAKMELALKIQMKVRKLERK